MSRTNRQRYSILHFGSIHYLCYRIFGQNHDAKDTEPAKFSLHEDLVESLLDHPGDRRHSLRMARGNLESAGLSKGTNPVSSKNHFIRLPDVGLHLWI